MWLTGMIEFRRHPQWRSARVVAVGSVGKARRWFDLDPVFGSPSRPIGTGQSFGHQAFQTELADLGVQRSAGPDERPALTKLQRNSSV